MWMGVLRTKVSRLTLRHILAANYPRMPAKRYLKPLAHNYRSPHVDRKYVSHKWSFFSRSTVSSGLGWQELDSTCHIEVEIQTFAASHQHGPNRFTWRWPLQGFKLHAFDYNCFYFFCLAKDHHRDVVLVDTAGRMQDNEPLMRALAKVRFYSRMASLH